MTHNCSGNTRKNALSEENARISAENQSLQIQAGQIAALSADNQRLSNLVAQAALPSVPHVDPQLADL